MGCCESLFLGAHEVSPKLDLSVPIQGIPHRGSRRLDFVDNEDNGATVDDAPLLEQLPQLPSTEGIPVVEGTLDEDILERMLAEVDELSE
jgi:hypothetical protein